MNKPTAEFQLEFLDYIQRLLDGGGFTATYKFALLMALADLSVESGVETSASLKLHARDVALKFVRFYSRQAIPYKSPAGAEPAVIHQNTDRQARVVNLVREAIPVYRTSGLRHTVSILQADTKLVSDITATVATMPLWKLQTIAGTVDDFLYDNRGTGREFELRPGIAFCFRRFHGFIYRLAQDGWVRFVRERHQNHRLLGNTADLAQFMFGVDRAQLTPYRELFRQLQDGRCFYCSHTHQEGHVDHFIPWSWYSLDLGHNFVLACKTCNGKKGDMLAAPEHLVRWLTRNRRFDTEMREYFDEKCLPHDREGSVHIARWAYGRVVETGGHTWVGGKVFRRIADEGDWRFPAS